MLGARDHLSAGAGQLYYYDEHLNEFSETSSDHNDQEEVRIDEEQADSYGECAAVTAVEKSGVDASGTHVGGVFQQLHRGVSQPLAFFSVKLKPAE